MRPGDRSNAALRYRLFAHEYATNGFNATRAALNAGYSPKTAYSQGNDLLKMSEVQALIAEFTQPVFEKHDITIDNTLRHLAAVGYSDFRELGDWGLENGVPYFRPRNRDDLTEMAALTVAGVKMKAKYHPARYIDGELVEEEYYDVEVEVKQHDKLAALDKLMRYQGLLPTTGKVRINVDNRNQELNVFDLAGLSREEILALANMEVAGEQ